MTARERKISLWIIGSVAMLVLLECMGFEAPVFWAGTLGIGWIRFLLRVGPMIRFKWGMILSAMVYAAMLVAGSHLFLRWLCLHLSVNHRWHTRWTLSGFAIVVMMFVVGVSAVGISDHLTRLIASTQPIFKPRRDRERANRVKCASNLHQIGLGLLLYANENDGHYPPDLAVMMREERMTANVFLCPDADDEIDDVATQPADTLLGRHHCSYIYLGKGLVAPVSDTRVIAVEPLAHHNEDGINVLFGNGNVEWIEREKAVALLAACGLKADGSASPATSP